MARVVDEHRVGAVGIDTARAFASHIQQVARLDVELQAVAVDADACRFGAEELADEARQRRHRTASLSAGDGDDRVALLGGRALVNDQADRPIALPHLLRRVAEDNERNTVERDAAERTALDLHGHSERARALGRTDRHLTEDARANEVAATGFAILPARSEE